MEKSLGWIVVLLLFLYYWNGPKRLNVIIKALRKERYELFFQLTETELARKVSFINKSNILILKGTAFFYLGEFEQSISIFSRINMVTLDRNMQKKLLLYYSLSLFFNKQEQEFQKLFITYDKVLNDKHGRRKVNQQLKTLYGIRLYVENDFEKCIEHFHYMVKKEDPDGGFHVIEHFILGLIQQQYGKRDLAKQQFHYVQTHCTDRSFLKTLSYQKLIELK